MLSRTVTVQAKDESDAAEYAQATAQAIGALLLAVSEETQVKTFELVFARMSPELRSRVRAALAPED